MERRSETRNYQQMMTAIEMAELRGDQAAIDRINAELDALIYGNNEKESA